MPWCENCKKDGLSKNDVEFDDTKQKVMCLSCYYTANPGAFQKANRTFGYEFHLTHVDGLIAKLSYGEISVGAHITSRELHRLLNV